MVKIFQKILDILGRRGSERMICGSARKGSYTEAHPQFGSEWQRVATRGKLQLRNQ